MAHESYVPCGVYIMAEKQRFRVPTVEEMEKADNEETLVTGRPLFRRDAASKPMDHSSNAQGPVPTPPQNSPPKRVISQKALLSRQPLSSQSSSVKKKGSRKEITPSSSDKDGNSGRDIRAGRKGMTSNWTGSVVASNSRNAATRQRQEHQPDACTSAQTTRPGETVINRTAQPQTDGTASSEQAAEAQDAIRADVLPTLAKLGKTNSLVVNSKQRGNPILNFVRNVPWEYGNIVPDYVMGQCNCALYLSLRYHQLHPEYIHQRLKQLGRSFELRVLLVQVDIKDPHHLLKDLAKVCILADCTLMLAFSAEEAGRYLETYKVYENKAAEAIMERTDSNFNVQLSDCLTRVKAVNKTDCSTLLATFGSLQGIMGASTEDLTLCPGFGPQKAKRLHDVFREPFLVSKKQKTDTGK